VNELATLTVTNNAIEPVSGQILTFALVSAPDGMSVNPATGVINWTPTQTQSPSSNKVVVSVTDNGTPPLSDIRSFTVFVKEVNVAPVLPTIATPDCFCPDSSDSGQYSDRTKYPRNTELLPGQSTDGSVH